MYTTLSMKRAMALVLMLGVGSAGLSACGAEERQGARVEVGQRQVLTREFVLNAPSADRRRALGEWQAEGERAAMGLKEIALSPTRDPQDRWFAIEDLKRVQPWDAVNWYVMNLTLRVHLSTYRSEPVPDFPCASALVNMGWASVVLLVTAAEGPQELEWLESKPEPEWMRLAGLVIRLVARKQAHAVVMALQNVETGLVNYLGN